MLIILFFSVYLFYTNLRLLKDREGIDALEALCFPSDSTLITTSILLVM